MLNTNTPTYNSWKAMRQRVLFRKGTRYQQLTICGEWKDSYETFFEDMGERPCNSTLDREDNDLGYSKENCRWASKKEQSNNRSNNVRVLYKGINNTIAEWCAVLGLSEKELHNAYKRHNKYNATTFEELFCKNLYSHRINNRENKCACGKTEAIKWYSAGTECNNCYHKRRRKEKIENDS